MRKKLIATMAFCAAVVLAAQGQTPSSSSPSSTDTSKSTDQSGSSSSSIGISGSTSTSKGLSATGRSAHQGIRASQLTSADVKSTSGETLGTISDVIINPNSGRVEFAILSLSGSAGGTSSPGANSGVSSSTSGLTPSQGTSASSSGKQVAVPWSLIRAGNESSSSSSTMGQSFVFNGEATKLQSAPTFDTSTDLQGSWRQSVFSHFGVSANSSGSENYGGRSYGTSGSSSGASTSPGSSSSGSSSTTPDSSSSSSSKQP